jgi:predicted dehydrogenase
VIQLAIIGAGQIGSRHLQGLARLGRAAEVVLVDPNASALATARNHLAELAPPDSLRVRFAQSLEEIPRVVDIAIVATNSDVRRSVIEHLLGRATVGALVLEKVLFQRLDDYDAIAALLEARAVNAWVNCARRMWPIYNELTAELRGASRVDAIVSGARWGIGSNAIHFLDLVAMLAGEDTLGVSELDLDPESIASKRAGFREFTGTLRGNLARGSVTLSSHLEGGAPPAIHVASDRLHCVVRERERTLVMANATTGWGWIERTIDAPLQSQLTHLLVAAIADTGTCPLTSFATSARIHKSLVAALLRHVNRGRQTPIEACPIT